MCISSLDWDAHWTSKQQIMHRLAAGNRVLYVEEPVTMLAPLRVPSRWRRWKALRPTLRRAEDRLWVLTPPPLLPFGNLRPRVNRVNQRILAGYVAWAARRLRMRDYALWTYLPTSVDLVDRLDPALLVYHCVDEHSAFPGFVDPETVTGYDEALSRRSDIVITTAAGLRDSRAHLNERVHHVPNAADVTHFEQALDPGLRIPADLAAIPGPRIGVVGVHDERLDLDALEELSTAAEAEGWRIVLIGPIQPGDVDEDRLAALPRVHVMGGRSLAELPAYLKGMDVALIPYRLNELTRNIFPLKLFEYLAAGVPVVSAALPELRPYEGWIGLAGAPGEYPGLVRKALAQSPEVRDAGVALARRNTWDHRVEVISSLVEEAWSARRSAEDGRELGAAGRAGGGRNDERDRGGNG